jgi:hypothetical protein
MPVKSESEFEHVRIAKPLATRLRRIANHFHRRGIQIDANLAVRQYVEAWEWQKKYGSKKKNQTRKANETNSRNQ